MTEKDRKDVAKFIAEEIQLCASYGVPMKNIACVTFWERFYLNEDYRPIVLNTLIKNFQCHIKCDIWKYFRGNCEDQLHISAYFSTPCPAPRQKLFEMETGIKMKLDEKRVPLSWVLPSGEEVVGWTYFKAPRVARNTKQGPVAVGDENGKEDKKKNETKKDTDKKSRIGKSDLRF